MELDNLYQELIIDHGTQPRNHYALQDPSMDAEGYNPLCGDKVHVYLKVNNNQIGDVSFTGQGCAISMASASIMCEYLKNKTIDQALEIFNKFQKLVTEENTSSIDLGKLSALAGVRKFPARVKCATLAWHTLQKALESGEKSE